MGIKVLISSHIYLLAEGIKHLLTEDDGIELLGIACGDDELSACLEAGPDVLVADQMMCEAFFHAPQRSSITKALMIDDNPCLSPSGIDIPALIGKGLSGILSHRADSHMLSRAIRAVAGGELWLNQKTLRSTLRCLNRDNFPHLTHKEEEVLGLLQKGLSNKEIAQELCISEHTVKSHCQHLFRKFGVTNRLQLVLSTSQHTPH